MDTRLVELYVKRGQLRERIRVQREQLPHVLAPLAKALYTVDRARALLQQARLWMLNNPGIVAAVAVAVLVWRPRAVMRTLGRGLSVWRNWGRWRGWLLAGLKFF